MNARPTPLEIFRAKGVPNRRMEDWKYTDLRSVVDASAIETLGALSVTIASAPPEVESKVQREGGWPDWVLRAYEKFPDYFRFPDGETMSSAALLFEQTFVFVRVPEDSQCRQPLRLIFQDTGAAVIFLVLEAGASLILEESQHGDGLGLRNVLLMVVLEDGASLTHVRATPYAADLVSIESISVVQEKNSRYRVHLAQGGAKLSRAEWNIALKGEGAEAELTGASVLGDKAHADVTTRIDHAIGNTRSTQLFKSIAAGASRCVYQGKITVRPGANGSDSRQTAKALLLGARAEADLKPELEILADDVKCAHGAAVGDLDADSLFYLRSRGIPENESRAMLMRGFLEEAVDTIEDESLRSAAWEIVERGLTETMKAQS